MNKEQLLALVVVAGMDLAQVAEGIEKAAELYHLSKDKEEKKVLAAKFTELANFYNSEAKTSTYLTDVKKVQFTSIVTDSKNPTPGEVKTYRKPKDLTDAEKLEINALLDAKEKRAVIAEKYNVHPSTISDIVAARNKANAPTTAAAAPEAGAQPQ